jgi:hypothetical protein
MRKAMAELESQAADEYSKNEGKSNDIEAENQSEEARLQAFADAFGM